MAQDITVQFRRGYNFPIETTRVVSSVSARDSIGASVRWEGMIVYVTADSQTYILRGGVTNSDWDLFGHANAITNTFTTVDSKTVTVTNGLITSIV